MLTRQRTASRLTELANDKSIYPWIKGPLVGRFETCSIVNNPNNIVMIGEYGGYVFLGMGDGIYDAHSLILPEGRGKWALKAAHEALDSIFEIATEVTMMVPKGNIAVRALVLRLGAKLKERRENGWWRDGASIPTDIFSITKEDWTKCR
jgi:RimJ/RimL family protein N-acetyltransferase